MQGYVASPIQNGNFSEIRSFTTQSTLGSVPATPVNLSPSGSASPGVTTSGPSVTLSWAVSAGSPTSSYFRAEVRKVSDGALVQQFPLQDTSPVVAELSYATSYFWRVAACNSSGCSNDSVNQYFSTPSAPPLLSTPDVPVPITGSLTAPGTPQPTSAVNLDWAPAARANRYRIDVQRTSGQQVATGVPAIIPPWRTAPLAEGQSHRWRIQACNSTCSQWSDWRYFAPGITPSAPPVPTGLRPGSISAANPEEVSTPIILRWNQTIPTSNRFKVHAEDELGTVLLHDSDVSGTERALDIPVNRNVWWSLQACIDENCSTPPVKRYMHNRVRVPVGLRPGFPNSPGQFQSPGQVLLSWLRVDGAQKYIVEISDGTTRLVESTGYVMVANSNTRYSWTVRACAGDALNSCTAPSSETYFSTKPFDLSEPPLRVLPLDNKDWRENVIIVIHGRSNSSDSWPKGMVNAICTKLNLGTPIALPSATNYAYPTKYCSNARWAVFAFDWRDYAAALPDKVLANASNLGRQFANNVSPVVRNVHVIAHSAGSGFAKEFGKAWKDGNANRTVHATFLDAYCPQSTGHCDYGKGLDFSEQYVDDGALPYTEDELGDTANIFVNRLDANSRLTVGPIGSVAQREHAFPHQLYRWSASDFEVEEVYPFLAFSFLEEHEVALLTYGAGVSAWWQPNASGLSGSEVSTWIRSLRASVPSGRVDLPRFPLASPAQNTPTSPTPQSFGLSGFNYAGSTPVTACAGGGISQGIISVITCTNPSINGQPVQRGANTQVGMTSLPFDLAGRGDRVSFEFRFTQGSEGEVQLWIDDVLLYVGSQNFAQSGWIETGSIEIQSLLPGRSQLRLVAKSVDGQPVSAEIRNLNFERHFATAGDLILRSGFELADTATPAPDLAAVQASVTQNLLGAGEAQTILMSVRNIGQAAAEPSITSVRWVSSPNLPCTGPIAGSVETASILRDDFIEVSKNIAAPTVAGIYYGCITVDYGAESGQSNLTNDHLVTDAFEVISNTITPENMLSETFSVNDNGALPLGWTERNEVLAPAAPNIGIGALDVFSGAMAFRYQFHPSATQFSSRFGRPAATKLLVRALATSESVRFRTTYTPHADTRASHIIGLFNSAAGFAQVPSQLAVTDIPKEGFGLLFGKSGATDNNSSIVIVRFNGTGTPEILSTAFTAFQFASGQFQIEVTRSISGLVSASISNGTMVSTVTATIAAAQLVTTDSFGIFDTEGGVSFSTVPNLSLYRAQFDNLSVETPN